MGIGVLISALAFSIISLLRSPNYDLSTLLVQTFPDPEGQDVMRVVVGCLYNYNDRSPGRNASYGGSTSD